MTPNEIIRLDTRCSPVPTFISEEAAQCALRASTPRALFVGSERRDEGAHALRLASRGHDVIAINPRETPSAKAFRRAGGKFIRARVEDLTPNSCRFDLVCENY